MPAAVLASAAAPDEIQIEAAPEPDVAIQERSARRRSVQAHDWALRLPDVFRHSLEAVLVGLELRAPAALAQADSE